MTERRAEPKKKILLNIPVSLVEAIDLAVMIEDSDRTKFIRNATREKLSRVLGKRRASKI